MRKILKSTIAILAELIIISLAIIWYLDSKEIEPIIVIIASFTVLTTSLILRGIDKFPNIEFSKTINAHTRSHKSYSRNTTVNSDGIIEIGQGKPIPISYWEITRKFKIYIKNNSEIPAYKVEIGFINISPNITSSYKHEPLTSLMANDSIIFNLEYKKMFEGTEKDSREYTEKMLDHEELNNLKIYLKFTNSNKKIRYSIYDWSNDTTKIEKEIVI